MPGEIRQPAGAPGGQGVIGRHHEHQRVPPQRPGDHAVVGDRRQGNDGQLRTALHDQVVGLLGVHEVDVDIGLRIGFAEGAQYGRQPVQPDVVAGGQAQLARNLPGQIAHGLLGGEQLLYDSLGVGQQGLASLGEADVAANAVEQLAAQTLLQQRDAFADGGLGQMQPFCGQGKGTFLRYQQESLQVLDIHLNYL